MLKKIISLNHPTYFKWAHIILRVFYGLALINHGQDKLRHFSKYAADFPDPLSIGSGLSLTLVVLSEFVGGLLLLFGLFTRLAAVTTTITFLIAFFIFHHADPFEVKELALFYLVISCYFLISGSGKISLDNKFFDTPNVN